MDKDSVRSTINGNITNANVNTSENRAGGDPSLLRASSDAIRQTSSTDFGLQWGNRKRLRCMKVQVKAKAKDDFSSSPARRTTSRVDRRVVRPERDSPNRPSSNTNHNHSNGYLNLRQRPSSPQLPPPQRILRNSETGSMRGHSNGGVRGFASPDAVALDKKGTISNNNHGHNNHNDINKSAAMSDTALDSKKGGSSSGSGEAAAPPIWPPKFVIALTNKEKEEDFMAIKGSKLPQRPKKRAKIIQRTLNLVSPGGWLCDLTLERYEVREKKITKKRPRGLKAMGNADSESE